MNGVSAMKTKTRERTFRLLFSSLFGSDLTTIEIEEVANAFISGDDVLPEVGRAVRQVILLMRGGLTSNAQSNFNSEDLVLYKELVSKAVEAVKRRRISKDALLELLITREPNIAEYLFDKKDALTLRQMLEELLKVKGETQFQLFIDSISPIRYHDKYLKGIMENR